MTDEILDVAVVGGGVSGVYTAWRVLTDTSQQQGTKPTVTLQNIAYLRGVHLRLSDFTARPDLPPMWPQVLQQGQDTRPGMPRRALELIDAPLLGVSTTNGGGILNIAFVDQFAAATAFTSTYWIETVHDEQTKTDFLPLEYSQQTNIDFLPQFDDPSQLIMWPHVNVNTLLKQ